MFSDNLDKTSDDIKRTNTILLKLSLIIYNHPEFQLCVSLEDVKYALKNEMMNQKVNSFLHLFKSGRAHFADPNDGHLIKLIDDFFNLRNPSDKGGKDILKMLSYVFIE